MIKLKSLLNESTLKTPNGSSIRRYHNNVGKQVGSALYVHKLYASEIIPKKILDKALDIMTRSNPDFNYNTLMWDVKRNVIRFDEASDFDAAREPHVGEYITVFLNGESSPKRGESNNIWHHKWLWVKDDYKGFDVDKSKDWSRVWISKLGEPAKGSDLTWKSQLNNVGLDEGIRLDTIESKIEVLNGEWDRLDSQGTGHARQMQIQAELSKLWREKEQWEKIYKTIEKSPDLGHAITQLKENKELIMEARATPKDLESLLRDMIKGSEWEGKVFLVGGFVRDELMGKAPKDADVVVGKYQGGVQFTTWLGKKLGIFKLETNPVIFPTFGTANLRLDGVIHNGIDFTGESVDAVMFRKEQYHDPTSRKPTVQYTDDIGVDASRRDLTFNALYKDISTGKVIDPTGKGLSDLKNGIIRTPIDPSIIYTDDALRMFRAIRFATQLGFELSPEVVDGIKKNLHRLGNTSKERVRDELNKILLSKDPTRGIRLLKDTGLLPHVSQDLQNAVGMIQNKHHDEDVFSHILTVLSKTKPNLINRLGALLHDIGKVTTRTVVNNEVHFYDHENVGSEMARSILTALKYPNDIIEPVVLAVKNHMRLKQGGKEGEKLTDKTLRKFVVDMGEHLEDVLDIVHSDNVAHSPTSSMPNQIPNILKRIEQLRSSIPVKGQKLPVGGEDLKQLGLAPGPLYKELLDLVRDKQLESPNTTKEEYLDLIKTYLKNK